MKISLLFCSLMVAAIIAPMPALQAQSYADVYGSYNYKGNLMVRDTTFLKRLIAGDYSLDSSALVQFNSTSKGILVPRVTTGQRTSISNPAEGLLVYDLTIGCFFYYSDTAWISMCGGANTSGTITSDSTGVHFTAKDTLNEVLTDWASVDSSGNSYSIAVVKSNGRVGIGTSDPAADFQVGDNSSPKSFRYVDGNQSAGKVLTSNAAGNATWQTPAPSGWTLNGNTGTDPTTNYIGTNDSTGVVFKTGNTIFGYVDSLQQFNFSTQIDSDVLGIMTTQNLAGIGLKGIFVGDQTAKFGYYQVDARQFGFSKHLLLMGDTLNNHLLIDDSIIQLQSDSDLYIQAAKNILIGGGNNAGVGFGGNYISINGREPDKYYNNISDSCYIYGELTFGYSDGVDSNTLTGGMSIGSNILLGDWASMKGNQLVGHGVINGTYPGMSQNVISVGSHIDSNYIEGDVLMWNLGNGANNSSFSHNYLKNLAASANMQQISGQFNENVVGDTITGDWSYIGNVTLLGNDSIAFNALTGNSASIRDILMHNSSINYNHLGITNAGVVASQFFNSHIKHLYNQIYSSTFFNVNKDFAGDTTPWSNVMLIDDNVGIGITSKPTASFQIGDNSNSQSFRYVNGTQGPGKVLTSDIDGNASWQIPMGGSGTAWSYYGNTGTGTGSNYLGTSDNNGLVFKTAGVTFGYIDSAQMFNFYTGLDSDVYGVTTTNNLGGTGLSGIFIGDETSHKGLNILDASSMGLSKHVCIIGDFDKTHLAADDSMVNINSIGAMQLKSFRPLQLTSSANLDIKAQMITEFNPTILADSIADSSSVNSNTILSGATYGNNILSGGAVISGNYLTDASSSCIGNMLIGNGVTNGQGSKIIFNEMHAASRIDSNYLEGAAMLWDLGKHSTLSNFSHNYLKNTNNLVQIYGISGESDENVVWDTITGDGYSEIFNITMMNFDSLAYNNLSGSNTNINNLVMQNSTLNRCHFSSPNTSFNFSQLFNSHLYNDTVNVVNCFFHNVTKDFITETQPWSNVMLLNDNVGIGINSKPTAGLQLGDDNNPENFRYVDGKQATGKVLTCDSSGNASWEYAGSDTAQIADSTAYFTPGAFDSLGPGGDTVIISDTVTVLPYRYNIIDSTGDLSNLSISLPASPVEGEWVEVKLAQSHVLIHYLNGVVANSTPTYIEPENLYIKLVFRASKNIWY